MAYAVIEAYEQKALKHLEQKFRAKNQKPFVYILIQLWFPNLDFWKSLQCWRWGGYVGYAWGI